MGDRVTGGKAIEEGVIGESPIDNRTVVERVTGAKAIGHRAKNRDRGSTCPT